MTWRRWAILWIPLTVLWLLLMARGVGAVPPLMRLFDLHRGVWSHRSSLPLDAELSGLQSPVHVAWDKNGVPHFFASNEDDLYRAQGYVMASQRLFQMDLITRQAAGRLSEWVGEKTMAYDRFFVRLGMRESAENTLREFMREPGTARMITAFTEGVNGYISGLKALPPEYILLGRRPEPFDLLRTVYMDKSLTFNLSGRSFALNLSSLQQQIGTEAVLDLFPEFLPDAYEDYVVPDDKGRKRRAPETAEMFPFITQLKDIPAFPLANPSNGSNNWAVSPSRSKTGRSLVANDTHLGYSLPNIWYENQLSCPDFNVYGVALVAIPGIVNGYNSKIAWGPTNGTTPVLDWFEIEFENETSLRYIHKGQWYDAVVREEKIARQDGQTEAIPVTLTKLGHLMHREGKYGLTALWLGHQSRQELQALRGLYQADSAVACRKSFERWAQPIQNFICADQETISLRHTGLVPRREIGEGRFVMDGRTKHPTMTEPVPESFHPQVVGAPFVLSANQKIEGPHYPFYLGWDFEEPFRGISIRRRLEAQDKFSPEEFIQMQNDGYDVQAAYILPYLLKNVQREDLSSEQKLMLKGLQEWIFDARAELTEPSFFRAWFSAFKHELFDDTYKQGSKPFYPKAMRLAYMLKRVSDNPNDSDARWIKGGLPLAATKSFKAAWDSLASKYGADPAGWTWTRYNHAQLPHVARLPGFGSQVLPMDGSATSIRGNHGWHGPVYKAVFELGEKPRVWMQVPGGNDGDPFSPRFERFVKEWSEGQMREVEFYQNLEEAKSKAERVIVLRPKG
ncbi:MAG: penicillin acylase family protein [Bdellovibrionales bacterium]|nr:penicillin acylase family protein [Bdellovibrionales bacterium]